MASIFVGLPDEVEQKLQLLAESRGIALEETLSEAIALYLFITEKLQAGFYLAQDCDGHTDRIHIGFL